jgi:hypothetical protein
VTRLRRIPIYGTGLGLTIALVLVADALNWSGLQTLVVVIGAAIFYVVTVLVPWLIREQIGPRDAQVSLRGSGATEHHEREASEPEFELVETPDDRLFVVPVRRDENGALVPRGNGNPWSTAPITHGPLVLERSEPQVTTR